MFGYGIERASKGNAEYSIIIPKGFSLLQGKIEIHDAAMAAQNAEPAVLSLPQSQVLWTEFTKTYVLSVFFQSSPQLFINSFLSVLQGSLRTTMLQQNRRHRTP
jgi:hypothetical protein